ncbi:MAG: hypothetical protein M3Y33_13325 [Actinomycetota bacterium]|nr:hypothetical protein [Actinomycetota bacterium]
MAVVMAAGLLGTVGTGIASASTYNKTLFDSFGYNWAGDYGYSTLGTYSTYTSTQIWINGSVRCSATPAWAAVSWCGVGGGNGTAELNIGDNLKARNWTAYDRVNIYANAAGCYAWGGSSNVSGTSTASWPANSEYDGQYCELAE